MVNRLQTLVQLRINKNTRKITQNTEILNYEQKRCTCIILKCTKKIIGIKMNENIIPDTKSMKNKMKKYKA